MHPTVFPPPAASLGVRAEEVVEPNEITGTSNSAGANQYGQGLLQIPRLLSATWGLGVMYSSPGNLLSAHPFLLS